MSRWRGSPTSGGPPQARYNRRVRHRSSLSKHFTRSMLMPVCLLASRSARHDLTARSKVMSWTLACSTAPRMDWCCQALHQFLMAPSRYRRQPHAE